MVDMAQDGFAYRDLEESLIDSSSHTGDGIHSNHVADCIRFSLPNARPKHDQGCHEIHGAPAYSHCDRHKYDAPDGQASHIGSISVIQRGVAYSKLLVEVFPERYAHTWTTHRSVLNGPV